MARLTSGEPIDASAEPLYSQMAGDEDMMELVRYFVDELKVRVTALTAALDAGDAAALRTLAHQLKGAAGGYGFPSISEVAGVLESELGAEDLEQLGDRVRELVTICRRAAA